jgi:hypothetical protein
MSFNDLIKKLDETLPALERVVTFVRRHWFLFIGTVLVGLVYVSGWYCAYRVPRAFVEGYYNDIKSGRMDSAWNRFQDRFRSSRWNRDFERFKAGFSTTGSMALLEVKVEDESWSPKSILGAILENRTEVIVLVRTIDAINRASCLSPEPLKACLIAAISMKSDYDSLMNSPITAPGRTDVSLEVKRSIRKRFTLEREQLGTAWTISQLWDEEIRIPLTR